jgi:DNA-binding NarL/FixJ family response regulator
MKGKGTTTPTRVMLVDDHYEFRMLMETLLSGHSDLEVVAQAGSLAEARGRAAMSAFDVAILDIGLPDGKGTDLIAPLREINEAAAMLVMSNIVNPDIIEQAMHSGADEVLDKFVPLEEIVAAVRRLGGSVS